MADCLRRCDWIDRTVPEVNPPKAADWNASCRNSQTGTAFLRPGATSIQKVDGTEASRCNTLSAIRLIVDFTQEAVSVQPIRSRSDRVWAFQIPLRRLGDGHFLSLETDCPLVDNRDFPFSG